MKTGILYEYMDIQIYSKTKGKIRECRIRMLNEMRQINVKRKTRKKAAP
jgi:hypothetical protein